MRSLHAACALLITLGVSACGGHHFGGSTVQNPENAAPADIGKSFSVQTVSTPAQSEKLVSADRAKITIAKSALEKEFLLQASFVPQETAPMFHGQKSRIVFFRRVENKVYLIEASKGLLVARDYPQNLLLAEYPVLGESATEVTFDFNAGMSRLFEASDWKTRDFRVPGGYKSVKAPISYIDRATFTGENALEIHQMALLEISRFDGTLINTPVEVVYYLSPYSPNPAFVPTKAPPTLDRMGFFEVESQFNEESGSVSYASKRDISKPIVFAISSNTPKDYKDAVRDGILYWNKAFGKPVIQVVDGPEKANAPNPNYNIVQWVDWDSAGFAYADAQMDPRTGEILHQQIYFTSAWARIGLQEIEAFLRSRASQAQIGLQGFGSSQLCDIDLNASVAKELVAVLGREKDPAKILKASTDLVREVVAHEVGHTLGLRHNFAGSLAANYDVNTREALFKEYFNSGAAHPDLVTSSSVMDYQYPIEAMMNGDQIAKNATAGDYDTKVIQTLYFGKSFKADELPLFCTDSHVSSYNDCMPYDAGKSYIAWTKYLGHHALHELPELLMERYIAAKAPLYGQEPVDVSEVRLDPKASAMMVLAQESTVLPVLAKAGKLLSVERKFPYASSLNAEEARAKTVDLLKTELDMNGGFDSLFLNASSGSGEGLYAQFEKLLADPSVISGTRAGGRQYKFSAEEILVMKESARRFFERLPLELVRSEVHLLAGESLYENPYVDLALKAADAEAKKFDNTALADEFASYLEKRAEHYLLATSGDPKVYMRKSGWLAPATVDETPSGETTIYKLAHFTYPIEVRKKAAGFLTAARGESASWSYIERMALQKKYKAVVSSALPGLNLTASTSFEGFPKDIIVWALDALSVESVLGSAPAVVPAPIPPAVESI